MFEINVDLFFQVKYAKVWLLIISIISHFICITISLGSFIVINSVAASRYGACPYNPYFNDNFYEPMDKNNCSLNMKYANIALIVIGATCMVMFVSFFIKLVSAFNSLNSSPASSSSSTETYWIIVFFLPPQNTKLIKFFFFLSQNKIFNIIIILLLLLCYLLLLKLSSFFFFYISSIFKIKI